MNLNLETMLFLYRLFGREGLKRALTIPGGPLIAKAKANNDEPEEILAKRDTMVEAVLAFVEECANVDND